MKPIDTKNPLCRGGCRLQVFRAPRKHNTSKNPLLQAGLFYVVFLIAYKLITFSTIESGETVLYCIRYGLACAVSKRRSEPHGLCVLDGIIAVVINLLMVCDHEKNHLTNSTNFYYWFCKCSLR